MEEMKNAFRTNMFSLAMSCYRFHGGNFFIGPIEQKIVDKDAGWNWDKTPFLSTSTSTSTSLSNNPISKSSNSIKITYPNHTNETYDNPYDNEAFRRCLKISRSTDPPPWSGFNIRNGMYPISRNNPKSDKSVTEIGKNSSEERKVNNEERKVNNEERLYSYPVRGVELYAGNYDPKLFDSARMTRWIYENKSKLSIDIGCIDDEMRMFYMKSDTYGIRRTFSLTDEGLSKTYNRRHNRAVKLFNALWINMG